ncbi:MAG: glycoside hydrolase family 16 protein [Trueperaceae bacterium]|nr:glycoside hydrolase family 16 protein [Trueperaceae bacterium]
MRNSHILAVSLFFCLISSSLAQTFIHPSKDPNNWQPIFEDQFVGASLETRNWVTCHWWNWDGKGCTILTNNELEWYLPENVTVRGGNLILTAEKEKTPGINGRTFDYRSGMVSSGRMGNLGVPTKFAFQYGYVEMRAQIPIGKGLWPAFWLLPVTNKPLPEIDVMEVLGDNPNTVYTNFQHGTSPTDKRTIGSSWRSPKPLEGWHTYAVNWQPDAITWYIDGVERFRMTQSELVPNEPMHLVINLAVGGDWAGAPDESTPFPSSFLIDYVKVWQHK